MKAVVIIDEDPPSIACHLSDYAVGLSVSLTPRRYKTCRISAFAYHDLTDAIPTVLDIAIPGGENSGEHGWRSPDISSTEPHSRSDALLGMSWLMLNK